MKASDFNNNILNRIDKDIILVNQYHQYALKILNELNANTLQSEFDNTYESLKESLEQSKDELTDNTKRLLLKGGALAFSALLTAYYYTTGDVTSATTAGIGTAMGAAGTGIELMESTSNSYLQRVGDLLSTFGIVLSGGTIASTLLPTEITQHIQQVAETTKVLIQSSSFKDIMGSLQRLFQLKNPILELDGDRYTISNDFVSMLNNIPRPYTEAMANELNELIIQEPQNPLFAKNGLLDILVNGLQQKSLSVGNIGFGATLFNMIKENPLSTAQLAFVGVGAAVFMGPAAIATGAVVGAQQILTNTEVIKAVGKRAAKEIVDLIVQNNIHGAEFLTIPAKILLEAQSGGNNDDIVQHINKLVKQTSDEMHELTKTFISKSPIIYAGIQQTSTHKITEAARNVAKSIQQFTQAGGSGGAGDIPVFEGEEFENGAEYTLTGGGDIPVFEGDEFGEF